MTSPCANTERLLKIEKELIDGGKLFIRIENLIDKLDGKIDQITERQTLVIEQTTKTNGRVTKLESTKRAMWWIFIGIAASLVIQTVGLKAAIVKFVLGA